MLSQMSKILLPFENKWVALSQDKKKVVASGKTLKAIDKKLKKLNNQDAILLRVLPFDKTYSP